MGEGAVQQERGKALFAHNVLQLFVAPQVEVKCLVCALVCACVCVAKGEGVFLV